MVIKGKFSRKAPPPKIVVPKLTNTYIDTVAALKKKPHQQKALEMIYDIANRVGPLMEHYGLRVRQLNEMSPRSAQLLGLNVNHGQRIQLRLRPHGDDNSFLTLDEVVDTMLHELVHNTVGPHNASFYKKWDEYRAKMDELDAKGIMLRGKGERLGGASVADIRQARLKKLHREFQGGTHRLGGGEGGDKKAEKSLQEFVREAAIRRAQDSKWCHDAEEEGDIAEDDDLILIDEEEFARGTKRERTRSPDRGGAKAAKVVEVIDLTSDE